MKTILLLILFFSSFTPTLAQTSENETTISYATILVDHARVRSEPSLIAPILEEKTIGDQIPIYGKTFGDWYQALCLWENSGCISTDEWLETRTLDNSVGYIWAGLTDTVTHSRPNMSLPAQQFMSCIDPNQELSLTSIYFSGREITDQAIISELLASIYSWTGWDNWLGYPPDIEVYDRNGDGVDDVPEGNGLRFGFGVPQDAQKEMQLTLTDQLGNERKILILSSQAYPDLYYVIPFENTVAFARADGKYYGVHPCATRSVPKDQVIPVLHLLETASTFVGYR